MALWCMLDLSDFVEAERWIAAAMWAFLDIENGHADATSCAVSTAPSKSGWVAALMIVATLGDCHWSLIV